VVSAFGEFPLALRQEAGSIEEKETKLNRRRELSKKVLNP